MVVSTRINEKFRGIQEPYVINLKMSILFGLINVTKDVQLPKGFDHEKELVKGRVWVGIK